MLKRLSLSYSTLMALFALIMCACSSDADSKATSSYDLKSDLQPLYDEVMAIHDEMMPRMSDLTRFQTGIREKLDTLRIIPDGKRQVMEANAVLGELNRAEDAMWSWMHGFGALDSIPPAEQERWLRKEKVSVQSMKDLMLSSMTKAEAYLE